VVVRVGARYVGVYRDLAGISVHIHRAFGKPLHGSRICAELALVEDALFQPLFVVAPS